MQLLYCSANKPAKEKENKRVVNPKNKKCLERLSKRLKTEKTTTTHTQISSRKKKRVKQQERC